MDDDVEIEIREVDADFADKNEDQIMEEGELSDENEPATDKFRQLKKRSLADRLGPKLNPRRSYGDDSEERSRSRLPDLVRELEPGIELDRATVEKMDARAKRFQLSTAGINFDEIEKLYTNLGIPENQRLKENEELREFRHEAVHITGFENKVQNEDLFKFFEEYNPVNYEWCDGKSANIVWALEASALKALANLSRPISETDDDSMSDSVLSPEEQKEKLIAQFEGTTNDTPIDVKELGITVPLQGGPWRIGKPSNLENWKNSTAIFMRLARKNEGKPISSHELSERNIRLRRDGGIISTTRKRRIQQKIELDQKLHEEHERSKKYTGPVGSNPWGQIAQDWTGTKKSSNDFEDDLKVLAAQLRQNKSPLANKDWDAPPPEFGFRAGGGGGGDDGDEDDHDFQPKRKRKLLYISGTPTKPSETLQFDSEEADPWKTKSKKPRMAMYSDQMENRKSAKTRILSSIKRKVDNSTLSTEIYEEEEEDSDEEDLDMRQKLSRTRYVQGKSKNGSSSIFNRVGSTRSRKSSEHYPEEDSGDSLERDKGEDLGEMQMQMKIQVTQSDAEEGEEEEGEELEEPQKQTERSSSAKKRHERSRRDDDMEQDESRDVDLRRKSPEQQQRKRNDLRSKISSTVVKIKTEKAEDERRKRAEDRRLRHREQEQQEQELIHEARPRQRSERRPDRLDQEERRRRREHERRTNDSRLNRNDRDHREQRPSQNNKRPHETSSRKESDRDRERRRKSSPKTLRIKKEKVSDQSSSSGSDSSSSSSSSSSSDSSSSSSSSDSSSDSDSSSSDEGNNRNNKSKKDNRKKSETKKSSSDKNGKGKEGIKDKLQEYLAKAKERKKSKGGK